mgnify:CR=1 FL=1
MNNVYYVGSGELTFSIIERIINENLKLELAPEAEQRIRKCRDYLDHKIASSEEPLYGITTGFGSLCTKNISSGELGTLQENLIKSHACSVGEEIRPVIIKLMMLLKAHALSLGHSGVQLITVQRILDFFNNDVLPIVYDRGSLGASGDLAPLANLFLPLIGVGDVNYKGKKCEAISVLDEFGWEPVRLMSKEGLALLNGTQFMSANGVFALLKARRLSKKADMIAALSLEAFDGRIDPFMECIQQIRPHPGQIETGEIFRRLLHGSELIARTKEHVQDPYSFRCIPQVHGATKDAIRYVSSVLLTEINSVTDNPTIFPDEDQIISGVYSLIKCGILDHRHITVRIHTHTGGLYCQIAFSFRQRIIRIYRQGFCKFPFFSGEVIHLVRYALCLFHRTVQDNGLFRPLIQQHHGYRSGYSSGSQNQHFLSLDFDAVLAHGPVQSRHIGIVAFIALFRADQRIYSTDI